MWPGAFSLEATYLRGGCTFMSAMFALTGDVGCSADPGVAGIVSSEKSQSRVKRTSVQKLRQAGVQKFSYFIMTTARNNKIPSLRCSIIVGLQPKIGKNNIEGVIFSHNYGSIY